MENEGYLFAAYSIIWALVFAYLFFMHQKQRRLQRDIDLLKQDMDIDEMDRD